MTDESTTNQRSRAVELLLRFPFISTENLVSLAVGINLVLVTLFLIPMTIIYFTTTAPLPFIIVPGLFGMFGKEMLSVLYGMHVLLLILTPFRPKYTYTLKQHKKIRVKNFLFSLVSFIFLNLLVASMFYFMLAALSSPGDK